MQSEISSQIRQARQAQDLTQQELADLLRVHLKTVSNWEKPGSTPPAKQLSRISQLLDFRFEIPDPQKPSADLDLVLVRLERMKTELDVMRSDLETVIVEVKSARNDARRDDDWFQHRHYWLLLRKALKSDESDDNLFDEPTVFISHSKDEK